MTTTWRIELLDQLEFYWNAHLRPRLNGLTDEEYLWEPADGSWSLRRSDGDEYVLEQLVPEPPVPPVTTVAWRTEYFDQDDIVGYLHGLEE